MQLIINDRVDIALALEADGVHLGQDDLPPRPRDRLLGPEAIIGFSTHNLEQARKAADTAHRLHRNRSNLSNLNQKRHVDPTVGLEGLTRSSPRLWDVPAGRNWRNYSLTNAASVLEAGADSVAVISALLSRAIRRSPTLPAARSKPTQPSVTVNRFYLRLTSLCARILSRFGRRSAFRSPLLPADIAPQTIPAEFRA